MDKNKAESLLRDLTSAARDMGFYYSDTPDIFSPGPTYRKAKKKYHQAYNEIERHLTRPIRGGQYDIVKKYSDVKFKQCVSRLEDQAIEIKYLIIHGGMVYKDIIEETIKALLKLRKSIDCCIEYLCKQKLK